MRRSFLMLLVFLAVFGCSARKRVVVTPTIPPATREPFVKGLGPAPELTPEQKQAILDWYASRGFSTPPWQGWGWLVELVSLGKTFRAEVDVDGETCVLEGLWVARKVVPKDVIVFPAVMAFRCGDVEMDFAALARKFPVGTEFGVLSFPEFDWRKDLPSGQVFTMSTDVNAGPKGIRYGSCSWDWGGYSEVYTEAQKQIFCKVGKALQGHFAYYVPLVLRGVRVKLPSDFVLFGLFVEAPILQDKANYPRLWEVRDESSDAGPPAKTLARLFALDPGRCGPLGLWAMGRVCGR